MTIAQLNSKHTWNIPEVCPCCGKPTEVNESGMVFCSNKLCSQKVIHKIIKMTDVWKVQEFGEAIVTNLVKKANLTGLYDCIETTLDGTDLVEIPRLIFSRLLQSSNASLQSTPPFTAKDLRLTGSENFMVLRPIM